MELKNSSPINSQGVEVDALPATRLRTQSRNSKLASPLRKSFRREKKEKDFLKI